MAILNGYYIHVVDEDVSRDIDTTSHPVESGLPITDLVKQKPISLSLSGKVVDYGDKTATQVLSKLIEWQKNGTLIEYRGRNIFPDMQIQSIDTSFPNTNHGGADFKMELRQVRIAKSAVKKVTTTATKSSKTTKKTTTKSAATTVKKALVAANIKVGDKVVFKGGSVYVSSDAKKAAATRSRSTCKVTYINRRSWATHQFCLQSTDGKLVCGWVDFKNMESVATTTTTGTTSAGLKQTKGGSTSKQAVYHTVKSGDTLWTLVNKKYKNISTSVDWILKNNPKAFSKAGDATTLKIGAKLLIGYK